MSGNETYELEVLFQVRSSYAPDKAPYVGRMTVECKGVQNEVQTICETIFVRGNAPDSGAEPFPNWRQPSVSCDDQIHYWIVGEGVGVINTYYVAPADFQHYEPSDDDIAATRLRFVLHDTDYFAADQTSRARREALRSRLRKD